MLKYFKELNGHKRKFKVIALGIPLEITNGAWGHIGTHMRSWVRA